MVNSFRQIKTHSLQRIWHIYIYILCSGRVALFLIFIADTRTASQMQFLHLTHWGRVTYICVSNLTTIGSDNGLLPGRRQAIIWTNAGILLIGPSGTNFSEILIEIHTFSIKKMHLKMSSAKRRLFLLGLNELNQVTCVVLFHCSYTLCQWLSFVTTVSNFHICYWM